MTPREPDRFEEKAREVWTSCLHEGDSPSHEPIATALRQAADDALERAAQGFPDTARDHKWVREWIRERKPTMTAPEREVVTPELLAAHAADLAAGRHEMNGVYGCSICGTSPAAMPAAEVKVNACQVDLRTDKDRECFDDIVQAATRVLRSEPVTPAPLLPRVLAALDKYYRLHEIADELRQYIASDPKDKRIAELEAALNTIRRGGGGLDPLGRMEMARIARDALAARAAKVKGEGKT